MTVAWLSVMSCALSAANANDDDDDDEEAEVSSPAVSIDLAATYLRTPGLSFLFGTPRLTTRSLMAPTSQSFVVDAPLKIDFNDRYTFYAGVSGSSQKAGSDSWSTFKPDTWKTGFSVDVIQQNGSSIPTVTLGGSVARPLDQSGLLLVTTTWAATLDLDLAVNKDETQGLLAGGGVTRVTIDNNIGTIDPVTMVYGGAYRYFGAWKVSARGGLQHFGGAQAGNILRVPKVDMKFVTLDFENLDDNDNRLFYVSAAVGWSPKPSVQLIVNVPLYITR
jgi:hypothetical protein